jgi:hypothetical protein
VIGTVGNSLEYSVATESSIGAAWRGVPDCFCWFRWFLRFYGIGTVGNSLEYSFATESGSAAV